jgi:hypothetical protein
MVTVLMLCHGILHYAILHYTMLCCTILILYCTVLPCVALNRCCTQHVTLQKGCEHCTEGILCDSRLEKVHKEELLDLEMGMLFI